MFRFIKKDQLESTNSYALELLAEDHITEPTVIITNEQTKGRGQVKNIWHSETGKSITFSAILFPKKIPLEKQFIISQVICLALYDTLIKHTDAVKIKWPNDIYIGNKKTCGILIENAILGSEFAYSICGVGININNINFPKDFLATSLAIETRQTFHLDKIFDEIMKSLEKYYLLAEHEKWTFLNEEYHKHLFKRNEWCHFEDKNGIFSAKIKGVNNYGQIEVIDNDGVLRTYGFKEIEMKQNLL